MTQKTNAALREQSGVDGTDANVNCGEEHNSTGAKARQSTLLPRWLAIKRAITDPKLKAIDITILFVILDHLNTKSRTAHPSLETLAKRAGVHRATASNSVTRLVQQRHLARQSGVGRSWNVYSMPPCSSEIATTTEARSSSDFATTTTICGPRGSSSEIAQHEVRSSSRHATRTCQELEPTKRNRRDPAAAAAGDAFSSCDKRAPTFAQAGITAIHANDPIYGYAERAGLPPEFITVAFAAFSDRYRDAPKRSWRWLDLFREGVRDQRVLGLWTLHEGKYELTNTGFQTAKAHGIYTPPGPQRSVKQGQRIDKFGRICGPQREVV